MLRFIIKFAVFILPVLLLVGIAEFKAGSIPSNYELKRVSFEQNIEKTEVIVTGASHAYYGIKPHLLGVPSKNIAYVGQDIYYDSRIVLRYLQPAQNLKLVIISISYPSLEYRMQDSIWKDHISFYKTFWKIDHESATFKLTDFSSISLFGIQKSRDFLFIGKILEPDEIDENGGNRNIRNTDKLMVLDGKTTVKRQDAETNLKHFSENVKYLHELLNSLKEKGVAVVFVTTPCFRSYFDNIDVKRYERMQQELESLTRHFGAEYKNYLKDERFLAEDFFDSDHLNTKGSEKFSEIIRSEIVVKYVLPN